MPTVAILPPAPNPAVAAAGVSAAGASANAGGSGAAGAKGAVSTSIAADDSLSANSQDFSQLLEDAGTQTEDQPQQGTSAERISDTNRAVSASALAAQEVSASLDLNDLLNQVISPQDASDLLAKLDAAINQQGGQQDANSQAFQQLRNQLQQIQNSGKSQTVSEVLSALMQGNTTSEQVAAVTPVAQRVLSWLQKTLAKNSTTNEQESPQDDALGVAATVNPLMQSLQASVFRAHDAAPQGAPQTSVSTQEASGLVTKIVPLAYTGQVVAAPEIVPVTTGEQATGAVRADLDTAIPPLTPDTQADSALPEIDLPHVAAADDKPSASTTPAANDNAPATQPPANRAAAAVHAAQHLQAAVAAQQPQLQQTSAAATAAGQKPLVLDAAATDNGAPAANTDGAVNPVLNPSAAGGHTATQSSNAVQPTGTVDASRYVNQAPITEQVHVAVKQANKEGIDHITIQLDPADLGRVEVKMHTNTDGHTQVSFTVDKPSTFDALSRDARALERSLQDAGIKADAGSMQFNLRQQPQQTHLQSGMNGQGQSYGQNQPQQAEDDDRSDASKVVASVGAARHYVVNVREGLDIRA